MERRKVVLVAVALVAAMGSLSVFLYASRAEDDGLVAPFKDVDLLIVAKQINAGETVAAAQAAGKIQVGSVSEGRMVPGALTSLTPIEGQIAQTTLYPGEQLLASKFAPSFAAQSDPVVALRQLKTMLDQGLITSEQYTAKRQEILNRM